MKENRHILRRMLCAFLALCLTASLLGSAAFAEQTKWTQVETASTSADFAPLMNGEYYEASTPSGEKNTLYVKGKTQSGVKMLRIALYNIKKKTNYINLRPPHLGRQLCGEDKHRSRQPRGQCDKGQGVYRQR